MFIFDYLPGFQAFSSLCGNPGREASSISRGQGVTVLSWIEFSPQYSFEHKVRETYKP